MCKNGISDLLAPLDGPGQHVGIAVEPIDLPLQDPDLDLVIVGVGPAIRFRAAPVTTPCQ
jgi:hypothetical protein